MGFFQDFKRGQRRGSTPERNKDRGEPRTQGWYPDPDGGNFLRFWNGEWTDQVKGGEQPITKQPAAATPPATKPNTNLKILTVGAIAAAVIVVGAIALTPETPESETVGTFNQCVERVEAKTTRQWLQDEWSVESPNTINGAAAIFDMVREVCTEYAGTGESVDLAADRVGLRLKELAE